MLSDLSVSCHVDTRYEARFNDSVFVSFVFVLLAGMVAKRIGMDMDG